MPLPWKKVRSGKISQLVNDHLHKSQKRRDGSSLVVETGFPTSLIDLFIKNKEKLKKPSKRKVIQRSILDVVERNNDVVVVDEIVVVRDKKDDGIIEGVVEVVASDGVSNSGSVVGLVEGERGNGVDVNGVIGMVLKVILVVGLAWGIKKMTLGITLSAFLLFLLDYLGKCVDGCLRPCLGDKEVFRIVQLVKSNQVEGRVSKKEECGFSGSGEIQPVVEWDGRVEEIRVEDEIKEGSGVGEVGEVRETKLKELLLENDEFVCVVKKSKKERIKSKVRKCFVRKTRSFRKDGDYPGAHEIVHEVRSSSSSSEELVGVGLFKKEEDSEGGSGSGRSSVDRSLSVNLASVGFLGVCDELAVRKEARIKKLEPSVQVWSCLVLGLIVLVGLVRGRIFALMLTLSWCLLLKLCQTLPIHGKANGIRSLK